MSRSPLKRAFGSVRRLLRRRRVPSEQEWLRLILLVRRMQRGQLAVAHRLDEIRALTGVLGSFRSDFGSLHEQLSLARESAAELEQGLSERLAKLDDLPDPREERAAVERRLLNLDRLANRFESLAVQAPNSHLAASELTTQVHRLADLAGRLEAQAEAEREPEGQSELARLYERIQELAEGVACKENASPAPMDELDQRFMLLGEQLGDVHAAVRKLEKSGDGSRHEELFTRLERLSTRLERNSRTPRSPGVAPEELIPLLARLEALVLRLDQVSEGLTAGAPAASSSFEVAPDLAPEIEELRVSLACELEARQRTEAELESCRERLRASELARVELETRHAGELSQMADHVGRQIQRLEDDLKKKKRGLSELTQQNIQLQNQLGRLTGMKSDQPAPEPPAPLPRSARDPERVADDAP
jgi:DNA repair ATPase RecN